MYNNNTKKDICLGYNVHEYNDERTTNYFCY